MLPMLFTESLQSDHISGAEINISWSGVRVTIDTHVGCKVYSVHGILCPLIVYIRHIKFKWFDIEISILNDNSNIWMVNNVAISYYENLFYISKALK